MDKAYFSYENFKKDDIRSVDAKFEAQKIAFAPLSFQAVNVMLETGIMKIIEDAGDSGIPAADIAEKSGISFYGVSVLCEMALGMNVLKLSEDSNESCEKFVLGKIGWMLLEDDLTRVNFRFSNDICFQGSFKLEDSVRSGRPVGLKVFGENWVTVYEALSSLPEKAKKSWFDFDHFYSDIAFPESLPIVFADSPKTIVDIGGNTAKWSIACCRYDTNVKMIIADLPGQTKVAAENAKKAGFEERISFCEGNILHDSTKLPENADAFWMSQFLDCFSLHQITKIMKKIYVAANKDTKVYVLEPLWDCQRFQAAAYSLQATSLYFTCIANGNSKMYRFKELKDAVCAGGFELECAHHNIGSNSYSLLVFRKA